MPASSKKPREAILFVRVTKEERAAVRAAADRADRTMSSWTRIAIQRSLALDRLTQQEHEVEAPTAVSA